MSAVTLFDVIVHEDAAASPQRRLLSIQFASKLVAEVLDGFHRLREYEQQYFESIAADELMSPVVRRLIWRMFADWLEDAKTVLSRVTQLPGVGRNEVARVDELSDAIGRTLARLQVTPEQIERGLEDIKHGRVISGEELRNELRLRRGA